MKKKELIGIAYVSFFIMFWGTIGSLIDYAFLQTKIYIAGSLGQLCTFLITALFSTLLAIKLFPPFQKKIMPDKE